MPVPKYITDNAACFGMDPKEFYQDPKTSNARNHPPLPPDHICFKCPVMLKCQEWGLGNEMYGTWGGLTEHELYRMRKHLGIPQPSAAIGIRGGAF